jgi:hypothetical protein
MNPRGTTPQAREIQSIAPDSGAGTTASKVSREGQAERGGTTRRRIGFARELQHRCVSQATGQRAEPSLDAEYPLESGIVADDVECGLVPQR